MTDALPDTVPPRPDRDERGRLLPGHRLPGPGRPKGIDFRFVAEQRAAVVGLDLGDALFEVFLVQLEAARKGDLGAARFCVSLLVDQDPVALHVTQSDGLTDTERAVRLEQLLRLAAGRKAVAVKEANGHQLPS